MEKRKEAFYDNKFAHLCDEISSFEETPLINHIESSEERYKNLEFLNEGGAKTIYRCTDDYTGREVAMAKLKDNENEFRKERFLREAQLTSSLQHPNIVPVYDLGLEDHQPWFTMKLILGNSLKDILIESEKKKELPSRILNKNLDHFLKICDAMAYAHSKGVLHLDLKPENIQIGQYGDLVVCDWGLANILPHSCDENLLQFYSFNPFDEQSVTIDGIIKGTPGYMAPEQASEKKANKGPETDIFSMGAILYSILCFKEPFNGNNIREILLNTQEGYCIRPSKLYSDTPKALEAICLKAMQVDKSKRYESVVELQNELLKYRDGFATAAENANPLTLLKLWIYRNKKISSLIIIILIIIVASSFLYVDKLSLEKKNAIQQAEKAKVEAEKAKIQSEFARKMVFEAAPNFLEKAKMSYSAFDINEAARFCENAVELNPELIEAWRLKAELHFIKEQFTQALKAAEQTDKDKFISLCKKFADIKPNDNIQLEISDLIELFRNTKELKFTKLMIRCAHYKANTEMSLDYRIDFAVNSTIIMNGLKKLNFDYDPVKQHLDLSNNPKLSGAVTFQNFPAISTDFSNTGIRDFTGFRNQKIEQLDVSNTEIVSLVSLQYSNFSIRKLNISNTNVRSLLHIKNHPIEEIDISFTTINKMGDFNNLPKLKKLSIDSNQFTKNQVRTLQSRYTVIIKNKK